MSSLRTRIRPDVSTSSIGGQRFRMACASRSPSMLPGMLMSVKTIRMSGRLSRSAMASSALPASSTPKPASSRRDNAFIRTKNSSSTTSTSGGAIEHQRHLGRILYGPVDRTPGSDHMLLTWPKNVFRLHRSSFRTSDGCRRMRDWPNHLPRRFVLSQTLIRHLPQQVIFGPRQVGHFDDQARSYPVHA